MFDDDRYAKAFTALTYAVHEALDAGMAPNDVLDHAQDVIDEHDESEED